MRKLILLLPLMLLFSCRKGSPYEGNWVIAACDYHGESILPLLSVFDFDIHFGKSGVGSTPSTEISSDEFGGHITSVGADFRYFRKGDSEYVEIEGADFFTGIFSIRCLSSDCNLIALENEDKYIELIAEEVTLRNLPIGN